MSEVAQFKIETQADGKVDPDKSAARLQEILQKNQFTAEELQKMSPDFRQRVIAEHQRLVWDVQNLLRGADKGSVQATEQRINAMLQESLFEIKVMRGESVSAKEIGINFSTWMWPNSTELALTQKLLVQGEDALKLLEAKRLGWTLRDHAAGSQRILTFLDAEGKEVAWVNIGQRWGWKNALSALLEKASAKRGLWVEGAKESLYGRTKNFTFETRADGSMTDAEIKLSGEKLQKVVEEMQAALPALKGMSEGELEKNFPNYYNLLEDVAVLLGKRGKKSENVSKNLINNIESNGKKFREWFGNIIEQFIRLSWKEIDKYTKK